MRVGLLGKNGLVGQKYVELIEKHPIFELGNENECELIFSALPDDAAAILDRKFVEAGHTVISSSSVHRNNPSVPLIIPEINPHKICSGLIAKPNCTVQSFLLPLFPIHRLFGLDKVFVTTFQAVSGAGKKGKFVDRVIPFIEGEEEKTEREPLKILEDPTIIISAQCNRVPVSHGHMVCVSFSCKQRPTRSSILQLWEEFDAISYGSIDLSEMIATVDRLRECPILDFRFVALTHNLVRGAAGGGLAIGELWYREIHLCRA